MPLKQLLESIQTNLTLNIDSLYIKAISLISTDKEHDLGIYKEKLKGQIEAYLKIVVKNIDYQILKIVKARHYPPLYEEIRIQISEYLNEAIRE